MENPTFADYHIFRFGGNKYLGDIEQLLFYHPDLVYWLLAILALALLTGIIRTVLVLRVLLRKKVETPVVVPTPTPSLT